jgi:hypothetical protein
VSKGDHSVSPTGPIPDTRVRFPVDFCRAYLRPVVQLREITAFKYFVNLALPLHVYKSMSVLRTMSLIAGGALIALGGSALALFL